MNGIATSALRWIVLAAGLWCIVAALWSSPHHWFSWRRGQVSQVDPAQQTFGIFLTGKLDVVKWTDQTRLWHRTETGEGLPVDVEALKGGPQAAVLIEQVG